MSRLRYLILLLTLPLFTLAQPDSYQRDINDVNGNGIRDDVDREIASLTSDITEQTHLSYYAFFLSRFIETKGIKRAQSFANMVEHMMCLKTEEHQIEIKSRILDSENSFSAYNRANSEVVRYMWLQSAIGSKNCAIERSPTDLDFWQFIQAAYDEDICDRIKKNNRFSADPMAKHDYARCIDETR
ncbi:hypothetical protein [Planctobacterium marinum]|uniref:hypothetical protein n=1 Tax=Planctobacterium marinum TaxID=1631968 RepID=UPI001E283217|nr:hypothetical protein [Planctobacterium marinum]MCC2607579.1 hypothetical protein [Planctobacterium marinum]